MSLTIVVQSVASISNKTVVKRGIFLLDVDVEVNEDDLLNWFSLKNSAENRCVMHPQGVSPWLEVIAVDATDVLAASLLLGSTAQSEVGVDVDIHNR